METYENILDKYIDKYIESDTENGYYFTYSGDILEIINDAIKVGSNKLIEKWYYELQSCRDFNDAENELLSKHFDCLFLRRLIHKRRYQLTTDNDDDDDSK